MRFPIRTLARAVDDVDLSSATTAKRVGPPTWVGGELEIPFDRTLTAAEAEAVTLLLTSETDAEAGWRSAISAYLDLAAPTAAQDKAQIKALTRMVLRLSDSGRRQP